MFLGALLDSSSFSCYTLSLGNLKYLYDVNSYLNSEDSSNDIPKWDSSCELHTMHITAYWASLPESPQRHKTQHGQDHSFALPRLILKAQFSFSMSCLCKQHDCMITHLNEYLTNPSPYLYSHYHYFSSDFIHLSPGLLSEIPVCGLISF